MRVTSALYVSALVRRVHGAGGFAAVLRRGSEEAGAIHIVFRANDWELLVYSPSMTAASRGERAFTLRMIATDDREVRDVIDREAAFDSDCWAVEIEGDFATLPFDVSPQ